MVFKHIFGAMICLLMLSSCKKDRIILPGNDPNFKIFANQEGVLPNCNRLVEVFGIKIFAVKKVTDTNLLHTANVMAQYLDNDEDGNIDNQEIVDRMVTQKAFMFLWNKKSDLNSDFPEGWNGQDLGNGEINPDFVSNGRGETMDATLEEVLHLITHCGYAPAYPNIFGEEPETSIAKAMDLARGGQFTSIPAPYPPNAWYSYDDATCGYDCMVTEYHYWALTSILGAQEFRLHEIQQEWKLNTRQKVISEDSTIYELLTDPLYSFPTVLPDGTYKH